MPKLHAIGQPSKIYTGRPASCLRKCCLPAPTPAKHDISATLRRSNSKANWLASCPVLEQPEQANNIGSAEVMDAIFHIR